MDDWKEVKLVDLASIYSGFAFKSKEMTKTSSDGVGLVKIKNIFDRKVSRDFDSYLEHQYLLEKHEKYRLLNGDVLVAMTGQGSVGRIGKMHSVTEKFYVNQRVGIVRVNENLADKEFVYQQMSNNHNETVYFNLAMGAGQPNLSPKDIGNLKINLPPLPTQQKIAGILSGYDDLIENNLKRIKLLEEQAQLTYEEWFVRMKFPNHQSTPINQETGLPEGWEREKLSDVTSTITRGITPKYVESDGIVIINQKCIRNKRVNLKRSRQSSISKKVTEHKMVQNLDVLINSTGAGTLGRIGQVFAIKEPMTVDTHVTIVRGDEVISKYYLGRLIEQSEPYITNLGFGATNQLELSRHDLGRLKIVIPTKELQLKYDNLAKPLYSNTTALLNQNQLLKEARDILLPRLMTGMIDVETLDLEHLATETL